MNCDTWVTPEEGNWILLAHANLIDLDHEPEDFQRAGNVWASKCSRCNRMALVSTAERRITGSALRGPCEGGSEEDSRADISYGEVLSLDDYRDKPLEPDYGTYEAYELFTGTARYSTSREDALAYIGVGVIVALLLCVIYASVVAIF